MISIWIPASVEPPTTWDSDGEGGRFRISAPILALTTDRRQEVCRFEIDEGDRRYWTTSSGEELDVTHWMFLPDPPAV